MPRKLFLNTGICKCHLLTIIFNTLLLVFFFIHPAHLHSEDILQDEAKMDTELDYNGELLQDDSDTDTFKIRGYYKNLFIYTGTDSYLKTWDSLPEKKSLISDLNRIRISPFFQPSANFFIQADIDNEYMASNYGESITFDETWRIDDYNDLLPYAWQPYESGNHYYRLKINRAFAKWTLNRFTFTFGRQLVRFGSGRLWNPLDILNPLSPTNVEGADEQKGIDALRIEFYPTFRSEISMVYSPQYEDDSCEKDNWKFGNDNFVCRYRNSFGDTDLALLAGRVVLRSAYGADLATIIFDGMLHGSFLYTVPDRGDVYFMANAGYEYTFASGIYLLIEHFYNGNSLNSNDELMAAWTEQKLHGTSQQTYEMLSRQFITLNEHYTGCELSKDITPLIKASCYFIIDYQGSTVLLSPAVTWNPLEDLELSGGIMCASGMDDDSEESDFSELEKYPYMYASLKWHF